jgi:hypothetical protein
MPTCRAGSSPPLAPPTPHMPRASGTHRGGWPKGELPSPIVGRHHAPPAATHTPQPAFVNLSSLSNSAATGLGNTSAVARPTSINGTSTSTSCTTSEEHWRSQPNGAIDCMSSVATSSKTALGACDVRGDRSPAHEDGRRLKSVSLCNEHKQGVHHCPPFCRR